MIWQNIIALLAGSGVFIVGMNMMGNGLEQSAGNGMKKLLGKISSNRFSGVAVGATVTAIIQSSAATSVMAIGFVNAGIMTLFTLRISRFAEASSKSLPQLSHL